MSPVFSRKQPSNQRGIALAVALFALVLIGALVSGSFFAGRLEQQSGQNSMFAAQALASAEAGLAEAMAIADPAALAMLAIGGAPLDLGPLASGNAVGHVVRLTSGLFLVQSSGTHRDAGGGPLATQSLGLLVRLLPAQGTSPPRLSAVQERAWVQLS